MITLSPYPCYGRTHAAMARLLNHFDAHTDTYPHGSQYDHGTMFHHAVQEGLVIPEHSVQIGIRTEYSHAITAFRCSMPLG